MVPISNCGSFRPIFNISSNIKQAVLWLCLQKPSRQILCLHASSENINASTHIYTIGNIWQLHTHITLQHINYRFRSITYNRLAVYCMKLHIYTYISYINIYIYIYIPICNFIQYIYALITI